jgi:anaerobic magnesium-protoporphyrin IX monomethyl ester cyclase
MGINVLFIYPNTFGMNMLPPALALFSALLKREGHKIEIFDATYYQTEYGIDSDGTKMDYLNVAPYKMDERGINLRNTDWRQDLADQVARFQPDLIAISSTEDMWDLALRIVDQVRDYKVANTVPVIAGGVFPTFAPDLALRADLIDMVCVGEGENCLVDLCDRIQRGMDFGDVTNLWLKQPDGSIRKNPLTKPVDINDVPMIDVSVFEDARLYRPMSGRVWRMLPIETVRGCPYTCRFCNSPSQVDMYKTEANSKFLRKRKMDLVYKELRHFKDTLNLEYVYFWADTFLALSNRELDEFIEMYSEIRLPFWMQTRPETITDDNISRLAKVGLHRISFGIEHGNEEFRARVLDRRFKNADLIEALKIPHRYDVQFSVNNITGFPTETRELAMDTVELNRHIDADNANLYSYTPFHGTPLRKMCEDLGLIHPDTITKCLTDKPVFEQEGYPLSELMGLRKCFVLYTKFPKSRWADIRRAEADTPEGDRIFAELKEEYFSTYVTPTRVNSHAEIRNIADLEYGVADGLVVDAG